MAKFKKKKNQTMHHRIMITKRLQFKKNLKNKMVVKKKFQFLKKY